MTVYLLHFSRPLAHAQHYIGYTDLPPIQRLCRHISGRGSPLVRAAVAAGITVDMSKVWLRETRHFERILKNKKNARRFCPMCRRKKHVRS